MVLLVSCYCGLSFPGQRHNVGGQKHQELILARRMLDQAWVIGRDVRRGGGVAGALLFRAGRWP
eukprot:10007423-Alexandrium_andersonii.AAC.1